MSGDRQSAPTDEPPLSGGVFRRLGHRLRRWGGVSLPVVEELYGPSRHRGRLEVEEQRRAAGPAPSPGDRPALPEPDAVAARPGRFGGTYRLRRR